MYEFLYNYVKQKYQSNANLCYMDTDSFIIQNKTEDFYKYIADDVQNLRGTSNYSEDDKRLFPRGMNKKVIELKAPSYI